MQPADPSEATGSCVDPSTGGAGPLTGRRVLIGVTGGIAAYKTCTIVSTLVQRGAEVTCAMTRSAKRFVRPLTFEVLSGRSVLTSLWRSQPEHEPSHIALARRADVIVIAPATANIIAKLAAGIADDLISTLVPAARCPVIVAPAMNDAMWANRVVQRNVATLRELDYRIIEPGCGWMACRSVGVGRMEEPEVIVAAVEAVLGAASKA